MRPPRFPFAPRRWAACLSLTAALAAVPALLRASALDSAAETFSGVAKLYDILNPHAAPIQLPVLGLSIFQAADPSDAAVTALQDQITSLAQAQLPVTLIRQIPHSAADLGAAHQLMDDSGVDWLLWGAQESAGGTWRIGVSFSPRVQRLMRELGSQAPNDVEVGGLPEKDMPAVMHLMAEVHLMDIRSILGTGSTKDQQAAIQEAAELAPVLKADGLGPTLRAYCAQWQADLMFLQGRETGDSQTLVAASRFYQSILDLSPPGKDSRKMYLLERLGVLDLAMQAPREAAEAFSEELRQAGPDEEPEEIKTVKIFLGSAQTSLGNRDGDPDEVKLSVQTLRQACDDVDLKSDTGLWIRGRFALGLAYQSMAQWDKTSDSLHQARDCFNQCLSSAGDFLQPAVRASLLMNLGMNSFLLGGREKDNGELRQAVDQESQSAGIYEAMGAKSLAALSRMAQGKALVILGNSLGDPTLADEAVSLLGQNFSDAPKEPGAPVWPEGRLELARALALKASLAEDPAGYSRAIQVLDGALVKAGQEKHPPPEYASAKVIMLLAEADLNCDLGLVQKAFEVLADPALASLAQAMEPTLWLEKAAISEDPDTIRKTVELQQKTLDALPADAVDERLDQMELTAESYIVWLEMAGVPADSLKEADDFLAQWAKAPMPLFPRQGFRTRANRIELACDLASQEGDEPRAQKALADILALAAAPGSALSDEDRANLDEIVARAHLGLGKIKKDPAQVRLALQSFQQAKSIMNRYPACHGRSIDKGLREAQALLDSLGR
ncbi:MAG TPA: hypothetical protein VMU88_09895 [bacterium]|nr:hypothetical protein [bacterium]